MSAPIPTTAIAADLADLIVAGCGGNSAAVDFAEWRDFIAGEGLDLGTLQACAGGLSLARCTFTPAPRRFCLDPTGEVSAIIEVLEVAAGERWLIDLVAWPIDRPSDFATAIGHADVLGGDQLTNPSSFFGDRPLQVHRTPRAWLRTGCRGVVLLDERRGGIRLADALGRLLAEDLDHARALHRAMGRAFPTRRIRVPASPIGSAA